MANIGFDQDAVAAFCARHHIRRMSLFGSALRKDFHRDSDIDVLVEFEEGHLPTLFDMVNMERELSHDIFDGRKVDLRTKEDLSRFFRDQVVAEAESVYAAR